MFSISLKPAPCVFIFLIDPGQIVFINLQKIHVTILLNSDITILEGASLVEGICIICFIYDKILLNPNIAQLNTPNISNLLHVTPC